MARPTIVQVLGIYLTLFLSFAVSVPTTSSISKRDSALDTLWRSIPGSQKAGGDSAVMFNVNPATSNAWGITYMYGCTGIMIADNDVVVTGHLQQLNSQSCISLADSTSVNNWIARLRMATDLADPIPGVTNAFLLFDASQQNSQGLRMIRSFLTDEYDIDASRIIDRPYAGGSGTGDAPGSPAGKAVVQWIAGASAPHGTLNVFFNQEGAINSMTF